MSRKYTHAQKYLEEIKVMVSKGKTQREIAEYYGFKDKEVVKGLLKRERRKEEKAEAGIMPLKRGRPRKDYEMTEEKKIAYYKREMKQKEYDNKRLKMENELLRDFLQEYGRRCVQK